MPAEKNRVKPVAENFSRFARRMIGGHFIAEEEALKKGMEAKSKEFVENGAEVYISGQ